MFKLATLGFATLQLCSDCLSLATRNLLGESSLFKIEASKIFFQSYTVAISVRHGFQNYGFVRIPKPSNFDASSSTLVSILWEIYTRTSVDLILLNSIWITCSGYCWNISWSASWEIVALFATIKSVKNPEEHLRQSHICVEFSTDICGGNSRCDGIVLDKFIGKKKAVN